MLHQIRRIAAWEALLFSIRYASAENDQEFSRVLGLIERVEEFIASSFDAVSSDFGQLALLHVYFL